MLGAPLDACVSSAIEAAADEQVRTHTQPNRLLIPHSRGRAREVGIYIHTRIHFSFFFFFFVFSFLSSHSFCRLLPKGNSIPSADCVYRSIRTTSGLWRFHSTTASRSSAARVHASKVKQKTCVLFLLLPLPALYTFVYISC